MTTISASGSKLMKDFATDTEHKSTPSDSSKDFEFIEENEPINTPKSKASNTNDFEDIPVNKEDSEDSQEFESKNLLSIETSASLYVGVFDSLQTLLLTTLHKWKLKRKIGDDKELERFEELNQSIKDNFKQFEDLEIADRAKVRILGRVKDKVNALPFSDDEYDQLEESLILILREMPGYQLPPNYALMMAMANVMLPRILDVVVD